MTTLILYFYTANSELTDYYLGFLDNSATAIASILITTTDSDPVSYSIQVPGIGFYYNGTVTADNEAIVNLPSTVEVTSHNDQNKGIYLKTNSSNVTVIGQSFYSGSHDTFLVLPVVKLPVTMYVYYGISVPRTVVFNSRFNSAILLVGTENNTNLNLTITQSVNISLGDTTYHLTPGRQYSFVINRLQTVYIESLQDLTGSKIVTNKPISVFSGHECGNVPYNIAFCDYAVEQIPPTILWGKIFYTAPLANRRSYTIKTLAAHNSTIIKIYCNNSAESYAINEGEFSNKTLQFQEYCAIKSNKNILVVQFSHGIRDDGNGEPMMMLVPAKKLYHNRFKFSTLRSGRIGHYVNIIVMTQYYQPDMIYLIAGNTTRSLETQQWVPVKVNNTIEAYATQVNISEGVVEIIHSNINAVMTTMGYGRAGDFYGHPGGLKFSGSVLLCV